MFWSLCSTAPGIWPLPRSKPAAAFLETRKPPPETVELRRGLRSFLDRPLGDYLEEPPLDKRGKSITVGAVKWGVYAFFDYDDEPIYVGQTRESLGSRIGRHLTNQRTDAVAMSVLDPFEVRSIRVWPLPQYQTLKGAPGRNSEVRAAADRLNAVERTVFVELVERSRFKLILNEKDPPLVNLCELPPAIGGDIVPGDIIAIRQHPDTRIARRAQTIARLAAIIASRDVKGGLRRALATQADRLALLARSRFDALGGAELVETRAPDEPTEIDLDAQAADEG